ncbi:DnaA regulatory inactivator HdaA [Alteraurantiacibacter aestuarii]|uniref:ATPase n=1 Tax=Alteraurantiacibacter aestuarii TaxID=650004 RepID=UPI0031D094DD
MSQIALPLSASSSGPARIVIGNANAHVAEALAHPQNWPFGTAVLTGPPRSGKSLFGRWFAQSGSGQVLDDAHLLAEDAVFHRWNRAQEDGVPLLIIGGQPPWTIALPDLKSRLGAALQLEIGVPDDAMAGELLLSLAQEHGLVLGPEAAEYLVPRASRSIEGLENLVKMIDRLSLERKSPPNRSIWRAALEAVHGPEEPRLL